MTDADIRPSAEGFVIDDQYDLWMFDDAPGPGPYPSFREAQQADALRMHLASGGSGD
ncbi:hypothetical protein [Plantibacter cousiniae (nom. nud.)]|uniref:Uncharacterized protein n=1 Tax=Plantibacter cousiniae (nom. nud.) TaxID=199709 RepID=A0ABY1LI12_9MICO|nr:hypothetical protein [Plantibacter cousiniae]SKC41058.1 hypothetical protein SAMN06295973_0679 [Plantibacter cousiniae]